MSAFIGSQRSPVARRRAPSLGSVPAGRPRRGAALMLVMMFSVAGGVLALTAIATTSNATLVAKSYARENDLRVAVDAALAIGKARIIRDPRALPDTGYATLLRDFPLNAADGRTIQGVTVNVWTGPTRSAGDGSAGRVTSVVAEARDRNGNSVVRRLELEMESFAKFAYWSDVQRSMPLENWGNWSGPVWSNDTITIGAMRTTFLDDVGTAKTIKNPARGRFVRARQENQPRMTLPSAQTAAARWGSIAERAGWKFVPKNIYGLGMRLEFVALDLNQDGDSTDADEGFFKVFEVAVAGYQPWLFADYDRSNAVNPANCGDWHRYREINGTYTQRFYPASAHGRQEAAGEWYMGGMTSDAIGLHKGTSAIMSAPGARCYLGGDPHLRGDPTQYGTTQIDAIRYGGRGGNDTTFIRSTAQPNVPGSTWGGWLLSNTPPSPVLRTKRPGDAQYLFPLAASPEGVIYVAGTIGVSGVMRGRVTLVADNIQILDDLTYAGGAGADPACPDVLGLIAAGSIRVLPNSLLSPYRIAGRYRTPDETKDVHIHGVLMSLTDGFGVTALSSISYDATKCEDNQSARGCLYLTGGVIQAVANSVNPLYYGAPNGYEAHFSYDRCAAIKPPPAFPTTGRFAESGYYEVEGNGFNVATLFKALAPR